MAYFTAEELYSKNVVNAINIFDTNDITFTINESSNNFSLGKGKFLKFHKSGLYIIYVNIDAISFTSTNENLLLKHEYITTNGKNKQITQDLLQHPFKLLFDIIPNDLLSFNIIRPQIGKADGKKKILLWIYIILKS